MRHRLGSVIFPEAGRALHHLIEISLLYVVYYVLTLGMWLGDWF